jgi:hypothetical protein
MEILQQEVLLRHKELQERSRQVSGLEEVVRPLAQQVSRSDNTLSAVQVRSRIGKKQYCNM